MNRKLFSSGSEFEEKISYSRAVIDGDYVFVSGTTGYDFESMIISSKVTEQAEQCFINIKKSLEDAGSSLDKIVHNKTSMYAPVNSSEQYICNTK